MTRIGKGLVAGAAATAVLSAIMLLKASAGLLPDMNAIGLLAGLAGTYAGLPATPLTGWILHILIGVVLWGGLFALVRPSLPGGTDLGRGLVFAGLAWLLMMIVVMPLAGAGWFALGIGVGATVVTLVLHLAYGAVLGGTYRTMEPEPARHGEAGHQHGARARG